MGRHCSESQPAGTKNVVSIFIEVLYSSGVENIYYLNYISGKGQDFVESRMWLLYTQGAVFDWNYWLSVTVCSPGNLSKGKANVNAVNWQRRELCSIGCCQCCVPHLLFCLPPWPEHHILSPSSGFPLSLPFLSTDFVLCSRTLWNLPDD